MKEVYRHFLFYHNVPFGLWGSLLEIKTQPYARLKLPTASKSHQIGKSHCTFSSAFYQF